MPTRSNLKTKKRTGQSAKGKLMEFGKSKSHAQREPRPPFPKQHQEKPGIEKEVEPHPRYGAPLYRGAEKLKGKVAVITGGDSGIGPAVAVLYARVSADVAIG